MSDCEKKTSRGDQLRGLRNNLGNLKQIAGWGESMLGIIEGMARDVAVLSRGYVELKKEIEELKKNG